MGQPFLLHQAPLFAVARHNSLCASQCLPSQEDFLPISTLTEAQTGLDISPLGLLINLTTTAEINARQLLDGLIQEIQLRYGSRRNRPVNLLEMHLESSTLETADITELIYHLSRHFRLAHAGRHHFRIHLHTAQADDTTLALLKGLGFNQLYLHINSAAFDQGHVISRLQLARQYAYADTTLCFTHLNDEVLQLLETGSLYQADGLLQHVELRLDGNRNDQSQLYFELFDLLRHQHFSVLGNDCFVHPQHPLALAQLNHTLQLTPLGYNCVSVTDICGLGPGSLTREKHHFYRNCGHSHEYLEHLQSQHTSVSHICDLSAQAQRTQWVLDELLCYHQLNLNNLACHQLDASRILAVMNQVTAPATAPKAHRGAALFKVSNQQLQLTNYGIIHLNSLCRALLKYADGTATT